MSSSVNNNVATQASEKEVINSPLCEALEEHFEKFPLTKVVREEKKEVINNE